MKKTISSIIRDNSTLFCLLLVSMTFSTFAHSQEKSEELAEITYANPDKSPEFEGGLDKFFQFFSKNYKMPNQYSGRGNLIIGFIVEKDGSITDIKIIKDLGDGTGKEAIRVLKLSPKWKPGLVNGKPARVSYSLPIALYKR